MLTGYSDRLSVRPAEVVRFMISTDAEQYRADIVRLIHGDPNANGPGFKETVIEAPVNGTYAGQKQDLHPGSYVLVPDLPLLQFAESFTLSAWVYPTALRVSRQCIVSKWSQKDNSGFELFLDETGVLSFEAGEASKVGEASNAWQDSDCNGNTNVNRVVKIAMDQPLFEKRWQFVAVSYDAEDNRVRLHRKMHHRDLTQVVEQVRRRKVSDLITTAAGQALTIAASRVKERPKDCFNGKVASPMIFNRVVAIEELSAFMEARSGQIEPDRKNEADGYGLIAAWDFSVAMEGEHIEDLSGNGLHGKAFNMPMRAVTGPHWNGCEENFANAPHEYDAIHFHDDDLEDAQWDVSLEYEIPADLKSGIYAARLLADEAEDYLPFFVCPARGTSTAAVAFLLPTFTYLAYSNEGVFIPGLQSLYSEHSDGSGVPHASLLKPLRNLRPKKHGYRCSVAGSLFARHLSADLYFVDWMEAQGYDYDIITDELLAADEGDNLLGQYKVVATGSHPEYVSERMLNGFESYLHNGGRVMYFGGNGFYWVTSQFMDKPHIIEVRRANGSRPWISEPGEHYHASTGEKGGLWRFRGRAPNKLAGVGFSAQGWRADEACGLNRPYRRQPASFDPRAAFIFEGIGADETIADFPSLGLGYGAAGDEIDRLDHDLGSPKHALVLATATGFDADYQGVIEERKDVHAKSTEVGDPKVRADMVYFECPNNGAVFSVSSMSWFSCLSYNQYANNVSKITDNVLKAFSTDEPE